MCESPTTHTHTHAHTALPPSLRGHTHFFLKIFSAKQLLPGKGGEMFRECYSSSGSVLFPKRDMLVFFYYKNTAGMMKD